MSPRVRVNAAATYAKPNNISAKEYQYRIVDFDLKYRQAKIALLKKARAIIVHKTSKRTVVGPAEVRKTGNQPNNAVTIDKPIIESDTINAMMTMVFLLNFSPVLITEKVVIAPTNWRVTEANVPRLAIVTIVFEDQPNGITEMVVIIPTTKRALPRKTRFNDPDCKYPLKETYVTARLVPNTKID